MLSSSRSNTRVAASGRAQAYGAPAPAARRAPAPPAPARGAGGLQGAQSSRAAGARARGAQSGKQAGGCRLCPQRKALLWFCAGRRWVGTGPGGAGLLREARRAHRPRGGPVRGAAEARGLHPHPPTRHCAPAGRVARGCTPHVGGARQRTRGRVRPARLHAARAVQRHARRRGALRSRPAGALRARGAGAQHVAAARVVG